MEGADTDMNQVTEYAQVVNEFDTDITDAQLARDIACVFLEPLDLFKLWIESLVYKYL